MATSVVFANRVAELCIIVNVLMNRYTICPKCHSEGCTKDGIVKERQRYKCKSCDYRHIVTTLNYQGISPNIKRQALELYLEGLGFRFIARFLNCSHVAVYNWIKAHGESIETIRSNAHVDVVEMDEMHAYIGSKKLLLNLDCC